MCGSGDGLGVRVGLGGLVDGVGCLRVEDGGYGRECEWGGVS